MIIDERLSTYIDSISWDIPKYLKEVEKAALADEVPIIRRSMQSLISFLLEMKKPNAVLEIGTAVGFSSMFMSEYVPEDTQCIITIGGDGTLIQAARDLAGRNIPMLGINRGHLGFLNQVDRTEDIDAAMDALVNERFRLERRMMLRGTVFHEGKPVFQDIALNEIIATSAEHLRVLRYDLAVNDEYLNEYAADGVMVATPTGSTAYNLSAGGPVMAPAGRMMAVTPVCSHTLNARSIVISEEDRVKIGLLGKGLVTFDGDTSQKTGPGDYLIVERSHMETVMVKLKQISFMQNLSNYLGNV